MTWALHISAILQLQLPATEVGADHMIHKETVGDHVKLVRDHEKMQVLGWKCGELVKKNRNESFSAPALQVPPGADSFESEAWREGISKRNMLASSQNDRNWVDFGFGVKPL